VCDTGSIIYSCVPDLNVAYSVGDNNGGGPLKGICTNTNSISIEMVSCSSVKSPEIGKNQYYIPEKTQENAIALTVDLMIKYGIDIDHITTHRNISGKKCPEPMCSDYSYGVTNWNNFIANLKAAYNKATNKSTSSTSTTTKEDDEVVTDRKVNIFGKEVTCKGILKDGSNYLSCDVFKLMNLSVSNNGSEPIITVPKVKVKIDGKIKEIDGFNANGTNLGAVRSIAEALGKEVSWDQTNKIIEIK
jgi:N-acetylmuramoyl-L-alanine amidase CwlA